MSRRRDRLPSPPPPNAGYEFEVIELGPPEYAYAPPPVKARGPLIPAAGESETVPSPPPEGPPAEAK